MPPQRDLYTEPAAMEPLLPDQPDATLLELSADILLQSGRLASVIPSPINRERLALLVQEMNSYYSNLIEGHKTLPREIEEALDERFSGDSAQRANQYLSRAHVQVDRLISARLQAEPATPIHQADFLCWIHREFYQRLPVEQQTSKSKSGREYRVGLGVLRSYEVDVGAHQPPFSGALPAYLERFSRFYGDSNNFPGQPLIALAAAHHRLAWIHPFGDGNGRVIRLFSQAWLRQCKVDGLGLWTLSRGLARRKAEYFHLLSLADQPRRNDYDGRGHLSERALREFCRFFLATLLDQITFMTGLLELPTLSERISRHVQLDLLHLQPREQGRLVRLLKAALAEGAIERGRVGEIVGLSQSASRSIIRLAETGKLMESLTPKGPLLLRFDSATLESYFPRLYQDLPAGPGA